jgi:hypothetical protein
MALQAQWLSSLERVTSERDAALMAVSALQTRGEHLGNAMLDDLLAVAEDLRASSTSLSTLVDRYRRAGGT